MKIGIRCNPLKLKSDVPGLFEWLADNGFSSVDLMAPDPQAVKLCRGHGLQPGSVDLPAAGALLHPDETARSQAVRQTKEQIRQAAGLGLKTWFVCFNPVDGSRSRKDNFDIWKAVMPEVIDQVEKSGLTVAMEGWPGPGPNYPTLGCTPEMWRAMFAEIASPALGLCFDPSHLVRLGIDYLRVLREFGERVHHVHAKDCAISAEDLYLQGRLNRTFGRPVMTCSEGWWRYCIPGTGDVDWHRVATELSILDYTGVVSVELEDGLYMADEEGNRRGLKAALRHLAAVWPQ